MQNINKMSPINQYFALGPCETGMIADISSHAKKNFRSINKFMLFKFTDFVM